MKWSSRAVTALVVLCVAAGSAAAQSSDQSKVLTSQQGGADVLAAGIEAMGGIEAIRAVKSVSQRVAMMRVPMGQSVRPGAGADGRPAFYSMTTETESDRFIVEVFPTDTSTQPTVRAIRSDDDAFLHNLGQNQVRDLDMTPLAAFVRAVPFVPAMLLDAWDRIATVRSLGTSTAHGISYDVISYADESGNQIALYFDAGTKLLARMETLTAHAQFGDAVESVEYGDYRNFGGLRAPYETKVKLSGFLGSTTTVAEVNLNTGLNEALLVRPTDAAAAPGNDSDESGGDAFALSEIMDGVYQISDVTPQYNVLFVEQEDQVLIIEAPGGPDVTKRVLEIVRETVPGKPIRLILTHHHFDHTAGLWTYLHKGIPVIAASGHEQFVRDVAAAPRTLAGVTTAAVSNIEVVRDGEGVIGSGANRIELIDVGPNPHADEILIAYLPERKLMWVADIYGYVPGFTPPPLLLSFADKMDELNLDIETILTAHTPPGTIEEYRDYVRQTREAN
jgi:glyoxylase-like metal-dependent hydrolase (beta-lactamase superfamily II)